MPNWTFGSQKPGTPPQLNPDIFGTADHSTATMEREEAKPTPAFSFKPFVNGSSVSVHLKAPVASIRSGPSGAIALNGAACLLAGGLGSIEAVMFYYDSEQQVIAMQPVPSDTPNSYKFSQNGSTASGRATSSRFLASINLITHDGAVRFPVAYHQQIDLMGNGQLTSAFLIDLKDDTYLGHESN